jgi:hypothetical protein
VRVERLQDISWQDAMDEGILFENRTHPILDNHFYKKYYNYQTNIYDIDNPIECYKTLWDIINGAGSYGGNPYVWVYTYERVEKPQEV